MPPSADEGGPETRNRMLRAVGNPRNAPDPDAQCFALGRSHCEAAANCRETTKFRKICNYFRVFSRQIKAKRQVNVVHIV
jgi:hypothetical protein